MIPLLSVVFATTVVAADISPSNPATRPEPEEIGAIHLLDPATGKLQQLEYRRGLSASRQSGLTNRQILEVQGLRSPVRFKAGTPLEFIVRVLVPTTGISVWPTPQITARTGEDTSPTATQTANRIALVFKDPTYYDLLKFDLNPKSGNRELVLTQKGFINSNGSFGIFVLLKRWTEASFHLRPGEPLPPGEYAFRYGVSHDDCRELHAFGIDQ
jgi:hypothetical protein